MPYLMLMYDVLQVTPSYLRSTRKYLRDSRDIPAQSPPDDVMSFANHDLDYHRVTARSLHDNSDNSPPNNWTKSSVFPHSSIPLSLEALFPHSSIDFSYSKVRSSRTDVDVEMHDQAMEAVVGSRWWCSVAAM
ncbi:hypothetical protein MMC29_007715 [Sticta canariensis]|nr:hypothetical protein [Sticta canariensis]